MRLLRSQQPRLYDSGSVGYLEVSRLVITERTADSASAGPTAPREVAPDVQSGAGARSGLSVEHAPAISSQVAPARAHDDLRRRSSLPSPQWPRRGRQKN